MIKTTEQTSNYKDLEKMDLSELLVNINQEDQTVPMAVNKVIPQLKTLVEQVVKRMSKGGRLFYIGAGTSGRLGIVDASECPPTFGVPHDWVIGIIAGGDTAIRKAVEFAEDSTTQAWKDLQSYDINTLDTVIGIAASGSTPYVVSALKKSRQEGILTACITCNQGSPLAAEATHPIEVIVGPEFVTGSSRMKAGTAQKLVLNMVSTAVMIQLGRIRGNKMVDMQLSNNKLWERGIKMLMEELSVSATEARQLLTEHHSVRKALKFVRHGN